MESLRQLYKIGHGPSSSHTMGPEKACKYILKNYINAHHIDVTLYGSLALTGKGHLTDYIIKKTLNSKVRNIIFDYKTEQIHPNTMKFDIYDQFNLLDTIYIYSVGGGSIQINSLTQSQQEEVYPFKNFNDIKQYCLTKQCNLCDVVYQFEGKQIQEYLQQVYAIMENSISNGIKKDGELPGNLHVLRKAKQLYAAKDDNESMDIKQIRLVSCYAFAVSEENASGGEIVTAPTCGASGVLPAILKYYQEKNHLTKKQIIDALAIAGLIGNVIKQNASISGAFAGCQSEIGSACSMAAAACAFLNHQSLEEIEYAAEIALEHHLGLTCDPINGLVQIPCIERNAVAALRAIDAASLANFLNGTRKISFDTVVKTMYETGKDLDKKYKETSKGGLAKNYCL